MPFLLLTGRCYEKAEICTILFVLRYSSRWYLCMPKSILSYCLLTCHYIARRVICVIIFTFISGRTPRNPSRLEERTELLLRRPATVMAAPPQSGRLACVKRSNANVKESSVPPRSLPPSSLLISSPTRLPSEETLSHERKRRDLAEACPINHTLPLRSIFYPPLVPTDNPPTASYRQRTLDEMRLA